MNVLYELSKIEGVVYSFYQSEGALRALSRLKIILFQRVAFLRFVVRFVRLVFWSPQKSLRFVVRFVRASNPPIPPPRVRAREAARKRVYCRREQMAGDFALRLRTAGGIIIPESGKGCA
jgi:hypothetical protein